MRVSFPFFIVGRTADNAPSSGWCPVAAFLCVLTWTGSPAGRRIRQRAVTSSRSGGAVNFPLTNAVEHSTRSFGGHYCETSSPIAATGDGVSQTNDADGLAGFVVIDRHRATAHFSPVNIATLMASLLAHRSRYEATHHHVDHLLELAKP